MSLGIEDPCSSNFDEVTPTRLSYKAMVVATAGMMFSSSIQLTGAGQMLEMELVTGEKTSCGCSTCTHVHQPTTFILGPRFSRLYMDCTNPTTGYVKIKFSLSYPYWVGSFKRCTD
jgi:hypothetical protein